MIVSVTPLSCRIAIDPTSDGQSALMQDPTCQKNAHSRAILEERVGHRVVKASIVVLWIIFASQRRWTDHLDVCVDGGRSFGEHEQAEKGE